MFWWSLRFIQKRNENEYQSWFDVWSPVTDVSTELWQTESPRIVVSGQRGTVWTWHWIGLGQEPSWGFQVQPPLSHQSEVCKTLVLINNVPAQRNIIIQTDISSQPECASNSQWLIISPIRNTSPKLLSISFYLFLQDHSLAHKCIKVEVILYSAGKFL